MNGNGELEARGRKGGREREGGFVAAGSKYAFSPSGSVGVSERDVNFSPFFSGRLIGVPCGEIARTQWS